MPYINELRNIPINKINIITDRQKNILKKLKLETLYDVIFYFPYRYENRLKIESIQDSLLNNKPVTIIAKVVEHDYIFFNNKKHPKIIIQDNKYRAALIGFNRPYLKESLKLGNLYWIYAQFNYKYNEIQTSSFDFEEYKNNIQPKNFGKIIPIYSSSEDIYLKELRNIIKKIFDHYLVNIIDELPKDIIEKNNLIPKVDAIKNIHFPITYELLNNSRYRLAYEEFFSIQLVIHLRKNSIDKTKKLHIYKKNDLLNKFINNLPYKLTNAQKRVLSEIINDLNNNIPMHRLLHGDVGSGKTTVALASLIYAAENDLQSALMVPTEVLAIQHFNNIKSIVEQLGISCGLLTSSINKDEREKILNELKNGELKIIVGTHSLIQENVIFNNLSLIIIDEQHKFGVEQRISLSKKGDNPDILVMTATPIPRTLCLTLYGDLNISVIDEMPANRKPILTQWIDHSRYRSMLKFVENELLKGHQAYFVYPLIEESEKLEVKNAEKMYNILKNYYKNFRIGLLHGKLSPNEKYKVMKEFSKHNLDILVSTTVIEVGIDVKNATVIVIEGAERFGISQLHQLRGRVGRGELQSYCVLVTDKNVTEETKKRMEALVKYNDGFLLSEEDLKLRGPGEIFGSKQSGIPELKIADFLKDEKILIKAKKDVIELFNKDPNLISESNKHLKDGIVKYITTDYLYSG